ncbi:hypothetical protein AB6A40_011736 [Gnathostoma spinigerum]|uniref:Uncharacterized protein n=1 Tax=Gnathostoma spinigerum TaxID=75299 RepID=A0ABD6F4S0_9BILA
MKSSLLLWSVRNPRTTNSAPVRTFGTVDTKGSIRGTGASVNKASIQLRICVGLLNFSDPKNDDCIQSSVGLTMLVPIDVISHPTTLKLPEMWKDP